MFSMPTEPFHVESRDRDRQIGRGRGRGVQERKRQAGRQMDGQTDAAVINRDNAACRPDVGSPATADEGSTLEL